MRCGCKSETYSLKVEADYTADPIWCNICGWNLDIDDIPLSNKLKEAFLEWALAYDKLIDRDIVKAVNNKDETLEKHNEKGFELTEKLKKELSAKFSVVFVKSI